MKDFPIAVHLITESTDHYNLLIKASGPESFVEKVFDEVGDELAYVFDWYINCDDEKMNQLLEDALREKIDELQED